MTRELLRLGTLALALAFVAACGGDDDETTAALRYDVTGHWTGVWQGGSVNGSVICDMESLPPDHMAGQCILDGNPCLEENQGYGLVNQETGEIHLLVFDREVTEEERDTIDVMAVFNDVSAHAEDAAYLGANYNHMLVTAGNYDLESETIFLQYTVAEWAFCDGATGTISFSRETE